jgi:hypothetical protein
VDEEVFNMSVRKFLKKLGVTAQREIELAVRERLEAVTCRATRRSTQPRRSRSPVCRATWS